MRGRRPGPAALALALGLTTTAALAAEPAAPVLTLVEHDLDGDPHDVQAGTSVVDINSRISVTVDRSAVLAHLPAAGAGSLAKALIEDYVRFQKAVTAIARAVPALRAAAATGTPAAKVAAIRKVAGPVAELLEYATTAAAAGGDPAGEARRLAFRKAANEALETGAGKSLIDLYDIVRGVASAELARLEQQLASAVAAEGVKVMMGAWIVSAAGTVPLHLPGFDDYAEQPRYQVERFKLVFTAEQQAQYERAKEAAAVVNAGGGAELAKEMATDIVERALARALAQVKALEKAVGVFAGELKTSAAELAQETQAALAELAEERAWLEATIATLRAAPKAELPRLLAEAAAAGLTRVRAVAAHLRALAAHIDAARKEVGAAGKDVLAALESAHQALEEDLSGDWREVRMILAGREVNAEALAFGEKIKRFDVGALPASADLDLELAGQRAEGDRVVIKLGVARPEARPTDIAIQHLVLRRVLLHIDTSVGLVFAIPIDPPAGELSGFQAAPAYAAFLKKGLRRSAFWNNVLTPGLGLSVAALDFNQDGVPEMGIAGVVSVLRDWLQGGAGYNLPEQRWYAFVGVGLPLPTFGVSVSSKKPQATSP